MKQFFTLEIFHYKCFTDKYRRRICEGSFFFSFFGLTSKCRNYFYIISSFISIISLLMITFLYHDYKSIHIFGLRIHACVLYHSLNFNHIFKVSLLNI